MFTNANDKHLEIANLVLIECWIGVNKLEICINVKIQFSIIITISIFTDELGLNKDRYKSLADEMDSTFAELAGY